MVVKRAGVCGSWVSSITTGSTMMATIPSAMTSVPTMPTTIATVGRSKLMWGTTEP